MEIQSASSFLARLLKIDNRNDKVSRKDRVIRIEKFRRTLEDLLQDHYQHHWFPDKPCKGSGYRCLRINHKMDPLIAKAGDVCGFNEEDLRKLLPQEFTMWIDPCEVSYRIGENGSICVLYDGSKSDCPDLHQPSSKQYVQHSTQSPSERYPGCKETLRTNGWDSFNNNSPHNHHGMVEPYTTYVSS